MQLIESYTHLAADMASQVGVNFNRISVSIYERCITNQATKLLDCDDVFISFTGRTRKELYTCTDLTHIACMHQNRAGFKAFQGKMENKDFYRGTFSFVRPDEVENYMSFIAQPMSIPGAPEKNLVVSCIWDITCLIVDSTVALKTEQQQNGVLLH